MIWLRHVFVLALYYKGLKRQTIEAVTSLSTMSDTTSKCKCLWPDTLPFPFNQKSFKFAALSRTWGGQLGRRRHILDINSPIDSGTRRQEKLHGRKSMWLWWQLCDLYFRKINTSSEDPSCTHQKRTVLVLKQFSNYPYGHLQIQNATTTMIRLLISPKSSSLYWFSLLMNCQTIQVSKEDSLGGLCYNVHSKPVEWPAVVGSGVYEYYSRGLMSLPLTLINMWT